MMSAIWQFIRKHEIWFLVAVFVGLVMAYEITEDPLLPSIMGLTVLAAKKG